MKQSRKNKVFPSSWGWQPRAGTPVKPDPAAPILIGVRAPFMNWVLRRPS